MPITLYTADKTQKMTLNDYQINTSTSLQLIGYGYVDVTNINTPGQIFDQNFVALLQNFSSGSAPTKPIAGQFWFDDNANILQLSHCFKFS